MSPGLVLAYLMLKPRAAFCTVSVTRLMYFIFSKPVFKKKVYFKLLKLKKKAVKMIPLFSISEAMAGLELQ